MSIGKATLKNNKVFLRHKKMLCFVAASCLCALPSSSFANGFFIPEQNVTNLGTAYAGTAALAVDASTNYYNPAGLTRLCGQQLVVGGVGVFPDTKLIVNSATSTFGNGINGIGTVRAKNNANIPFMHYSLRLNDCWVVGASIVSAFGSRTDYLDNSVARYVATRSKLITADFATSAAYDFGNGFSVGVGVDPVFSYARLSNRIGTGYIPGDGFAEIRGQAWAFGFHAGILYEFTPCTRLGLTYHSRIKAHLEGDSLALAPFALTPTLQNVRANLKIPDYATFSAYHAFDDCWAIMADATWFHWSYYDRLIIRFDDGTVSTTNNLWHDSYRLALGGSYQFSDCLLLRAGTSYDKTPQRDGSRPIYNADNDEIGIGLGAQYRFSSCFAVDVGYVHVFQKDAVISQGAPVITGGPVGQTFQSINGTVKSHIDVFGFQITWDIG